MGQSHNKIKMHGWIVQRKCAVEMKAKKLCTAPLNGFGNEKTF
jgi:hypothetical protein